MKKIFILLLLISLPILAQQPGWRTIKNTNVNVSGAQYVEMFSNSFGNNIILQNTNGSISFYVLNPSTGQAVAGTPVETSGATLANITGDAYKVYVVYKKSNVIKCKYSTNAGSSWVIISNLGVNPTLLDAVFSGSKLHITYEINSLIKYYQYDGSWKNFQDVSSTETGTSPRIEALTTDDKIYVAYKNGNNMKSREYDISENSWGGIQTLYSGLNISTFAGFGVDASYIYLYYNRWEYEPDPSWHYKFYTRVIRKSDYTTVNTYFNKFNDTYNIQTTVTADNKVHTAWQYYDILGDSYESLNLEPGLIHDSFNNNNRSMENIDVNYNGDYYYNIDISSTHNDLYVIWRMPNQNNLKFKQYDTYPSNPTNLTLTSYNNHPKLTWNKNPDADVDYYKIYKKKNTPDFVFCGTVSASLPLIFIDNDETVCTAVPPAQCENEVIAKYVVTAIDLGGFESGYSNEVQARLIGNPPSKAGADDPYDKTVFEYSLGQNYPNPFNPSTTFIYSIKIAGEVTLKLYDMLGTEVALLVNQNQEAGNYSVEFNASELPSGIYFYTLTSGNFIDTKKLILLK